MKPRAFSTALIAIVAIVAIVEPGPDLRPLATFRVQNLEVTGTSNMTGAITATGGATFTTGAVSISSVVTLSGAVSMSSTVDMFQPRLQSEITPTLTSGVQTDDWNPTGLHTRYMIHASTSGAGMATLSGMNAAGANGELKVICGVGPGPIKILHQSTGSAVGRRFRMKSGTDLTLTSIAGPINCAGFRFDLAFNEWQEMWRSLDTDVYGEPTVSAGSLGTGSLNHRGNITGVGANTTTLTFSSGFLNRSWCYAQPNGGAQVITVTNSATAPVFACFDMAGVAANCVDFSYRCDGGSMN